MAKIVLGLAATHAPGITARAEEEPPHVRERVYGNYEKLRGVLEEAKPDVLLVVANDHVTYMFEIIPQFLIVVADEYEGPPDYEWLRIPKYKVRFKRDLAEHILNGLVERGFDIAFSEKPLLDHATMNPLHFLAGDKERGVIKYPVVSMLTNAFVKPVPPLRRGYQLGLAVRELVESFPEDIKVAALATGGLSHDPGGPRWGYVDEEFDKRFLAALASGDVEAVLRLTPDQVFSVGGGSYEILNWVVLWGIMRGKPAEVIDYVPGYNIGSAWAVWRP
ncbi:extradiol ring-cleavage dioxygenase [Pyrobaculum aerophilum]|uniref:Extradiol ring-cleavage dioxygenase n=1 Tax=Pyrobaculum aerophilum TaxID=13773 RepID=A0A371R5K0_9CREN|nr:extradiol ring-cleavage dioxygenase [Pyrobaculum aerophilum]RFA97598.1 extradiol ring-cleavage dioxygenase [Pyrobaculum aerophilum]RFA99354.1 extradiol ring-cleavage dioxygenase [Pyrobaculum aerophilum]